MNAEEKYRLFDDYLKGALNDAQRADLERRLKEDSALKEDFELYTQAKNSITARLAWEASEKPFLQTLEGLSREHFKSDKGARLVSLPRRRLLLQVMGAAAILLLIMLVWQPWQKDLYARYAQHPWAELTERGSSKVLSEGARAFNDGEYQVALDTFASYLSDHPEDIEVLFYQGICYLELDKETEAKNNFRQLFRTKGPYRDAGAWYLGLAFMKELSFDSTKWYLEQIEPSSEYHRPARSLLKELK